MLSCKHTMSFIVETQLVRFPSLDLDCGVTLNASMSLTKPTAHSTRSEATPFWYCTLSPAMRMPPASATKPASPAGGTT